MAGSPSKQGLGTPGSSAITQAFAAHGHALVEHAVPAPQCQALAAMGFFRQHPDVREAADFNAALALARERLTAA